MHRVIAERLRHRNASDVLDIACGPGDFLDYLSSTAPHVRLAGSDIAPGMVAYARERLGERARIVEARGDRQPFEDSSFDTITIMMAFHHFEAKKDALTSIHKLLKPAGVLIVADVVARSNFEKKFWNRLEKLTGIRGHVDHYTAADMSELARQAEFSCSSDTIQGMASRYQIFTLAR